MSDYDTDFRIEGMNLFVNVEIDFHWDDKRPVSEWTPDVIKSMSIDIDGRSIKSNLGFETINKIEEVVMNEYIEMDSKYSDVDPKKMDSCNG